MGGRVQVAEVARTSTDGRLANEHAANTRIWAKLLVAEEAGNTKELCELAKELQHNTAQVDAECHRLASDTVISPVTVVPGGDGFGAR